VVGFLVKEHGMSYRTGHQILALMMQTVADLNIPPSQTPDMLEGAIEKYTGEEDQGAERDARVAVRCVGVRARAQALRRRRAGARGAACRCSQEKSRHDRTHGARAPSVYLLDCTSTPLSVWPSGLASITPMTLPPA
jgi:hypothetical protein